MLRFPSHDPDGGENKVVNSESVVALIKQYRSDASTLYKSDKPKQKDLGKVKRKIAEKLESLIERNLKETGDEDLLTKFQDARQLIAKSHSVEKAINPGSGSVDPTKLGSQLRSGKPLSGGLKDIAETQQAFPDVMKQPRSSSPEFSPLDTSVAAVSTAAADSPGKLATIASILVGRPIARNVITSDWYQKLMANPKYRSLIAELMGTPEANALVRSAPVAAGVESQ